MKRVLVVIALMCFILPGSASAEELLVRMSELRAHGDEEISFEGDYITKLDTETGATERIFRYQEWGWICDTATAPDGSIYFSVTKGEYEDGTYMGRAYRIWKITPSMTDGREVVYGSETMVYEVFIDTEGVSTDERISRMNMLAVRHNSETGINRVYFSTATGAGGDGHIYYVDDVEDFGPAVEYYTVVLDSIPIPSCWIGGGSWAGDFAFDESDNLFLSSGNCRPSALYRVSGAGLDSVDSEAVPEFVYERPGIMSNLLFMEEGRFAFTDDERRNILSLTVADPPTEDVLFSGDPAIEYISNIALWPSDAIGRLPMSRSILDNARFRLFFKPDLIITAFAVLPYPSDPKGLSKGLPVRITIKNSGRLISKSFKVSFNAFYPDHKSPVPVSFKTPGLSIKDSGLIPGIQAGEEISLVGFLNIRSPTKTKNLQQKVVITAIVDSCYGDSNMPKECRVKESNEKNNQMSLKFKLPVKQVRRKLTDQRLLTVPTHKVRK